MRLNNVCFKLLILFLITFIFNDSFSQQREIDSLKIELNNTNEDSVKLKLIIDISSISLKNELVDTDYWLWHANQLAEKLNKTEDIYRLKFLKAQSLFNQGDYLNSLELAFDVLSYYESVGNIEGKIKCLMSIGTLQVSLKNYNGALEYQEKCLKLLEKTGNKQKTSQILMNIGVTYKNLYENRTAVHYLERALAIAKEVGENEALARIYSNMSNVYKNMNNHDSAKYFNTEAIKICKKTNNIRGLAIQYNNLALLHIDKEEFAESEKCLKLALENCLKINDKDFLVQIYHTFSQNYAQQKKFKSAYEYLQKSVEIKDTIIKEEHLKKISKLDEKYKFEVQQKELDLQKEQLISEKYKTQFLIIIFVASAIVIALLIAIIILYYKRFCAVQKSHKELLDNKEQIQEQNKIINNKNYELEELNKTKDKLISIIAHDLRNPLQALMLSSNLIYEKIDVMDNEKILTLAKGINQASIQMNQLLDNLLEWALTKTNAAVSNPDVYHLKSTVEEQINYSKISFQNKNITIDNEIHDSIKIFADINHLQTVFRNLISNGIKFSNNGGRIRIFIHKHSASEVEIAVQDNGVGIPDKSLVKLFDINTTETTLGTQKEKGSGLGLVLCKEFIELNGGKIRVESKLGTGSTFFVNIPVPNKTDNN